MGLEISGRQIQYIGRNAIVAADATYPSGSTQTGAIVVPPRAKGARTHVCFNLTGSGAAPSVIAYIYGYVTDQNTWYVLDSLNNGAAIAQSIGNLSTGNNLFFAESMDHVSVYDQLWIGFTSFTNVTSITQYFIFEGLHA